MTMNNSVFAANDSVCVSEGNEVWIFDIVTLNCKPFEGSLSGGKVSFFVLEEEKFKFLNVCKRLGIKPVWKDGFARVSPEKCFWACDGDDTIRWFIW